MVVCKNNDKKILHPITKYMRFRKFHSNNKLKTVKFSSPKFTKIQFDF